MSATDPVAIVTGAGGEIGQAIAAHLVRAGWRVALTDRRPDVHQVARRLDPTGERTVSTVGDVTRAETVDEVFDTVLTRFGRLDALVNNAAVGGPPKDAVALTPAEFRQVIEVNLVAPFTFARRAAKHMIEAGNGGRIVNMGSVFGQQAVRDGSAYCAAKGGLILLSQALALELGGHGITVNTVAPGYILTDMHREEIALRAARHGRSFAEEQAALAESVPLGRHGTPDDTAAVVVWLLGPGASYITGQTIPVNGGILLS